MKVILMVFIMNLSFANVLPIAHRGASAYAPENNISAIKKAIDLGSKFIEIDVHMTKDGTVVSIHDETVNRTSNGKGKVDSFTFEELQKFDFGNWFGSEFKGEKIPSLEEVLSLIKDDSVLIIELKYGDERYPKIESKIVDLVVRMKKESNVILKSFDRKILNTFEDIAPSIDRLYCTFGGNRVFTVDNGLRFSDILSKGNFQYLQVHKYFLSKSLVRRAHEKGIKVIVWDVHDIETMKKFKDKGVDFIESDNPDYVLKLK